MTPEEEEQVARALAETARHEPVPPLPDHVATRLDDVLADLVSARADSGTGATRAGVSQLDARRRRRSHRLVAAAAVALVVAAGGVVAVRDGIGINPASDESASSSADSGGSGQLDTAQGEAAAPSAAAKAAPPRLRSSSLARDVRRVLADDRADARDSVRPRRKGLTGPPYAAGGCAAPSAGPGEQLLAVRLDGRPATLLLGPVTDSSRFAQVYSCRAAKPVASATVRLP